MKVVSWNVNSIRARLENVLRWLDEEAPDVVLLQETKCIDEAFPRDFFEDRGYNVELYGQKTYNGVAILSKHPIEDVQRGLSNFEDDQARYIEGVVNGYVRVASVYVPNGESKESPKFTYKMQFLDALREYLPDRLFTDEVFIVGGDYNIAPTPQDITMEEKWEGSVMCTPAEREQFQALLSSGFIDIARKFHPYGKEETPDLTTWWNYRAGAWQKNDGLRIDHLLVSRSNAGMVKEMGVHRHTRGWEKPSDHAPVWCAVER